MRSLSLVLLFALELPWIASAAPVANPLRPTDKFRVKIQTLEAAPGTDPANLRTYLGVRVLFCVETESAPLCQPLGSTGGIDVKAGETKNFEREKSQTMPALYSEVVTGEAVGGMIDSLPVGPSFGATFLKLELRTYRAAAGSDVGSVDTRDGRTVSLRRAPFPAIDLSPNNSERVLSSKQPLPIEPGRTAYGAVVSILIQRK